jgi:hypothetical protein
MVALVLNTTVVLFLAVLLATGLLVLYVLERIWPTRRRRALAVDALQVADVRPPAARHDTDDLLASDAVRADVLELDVPRRSLSVTDAAPSRPHAGNGSVDENRTDAGSGADDGEPIGSVDAGARDGRVPEPGVLAGVAGNVWTDVPETSDERHAEDQQLPTTRIERLIAERRFDEASVMATRELDEAADGGVRAELLALLAEARGGLGDHAGAAEVFHSALDSAPDDERERYRLRYVAFAADTVRALIARSQAAPGDTERVAALVRARTLLGVADRQPVRDQALDEAVAQVNAMYWPAYESAVRALVRQHDFAEVRRRVTDALADPALPASHRHAFDGLQADAVAAQIDQLASVGVRAFAEGREREAIASLKLAEAVMADAGPWFGEERREDASRQLCSAYTEVGGRRLDAGDANGALEPLFRALRHAASDAARHAEASEAMSRAVSSIVEERVRAVRETPSATPASMAGQIDKLWRLVQRAVDAGVPEAMLEHGMALLRALERDAAR